MRVLVLSPVVPFPANSGDRRRISAVATRLAERHDVTLACIGDVNAKARVPNVIHEVHLAGQRQSKSLAVFDVMLTGKTYRQARFYSREFLRLVETVLVVNAFDVIVVNFLNMVTYLKPWLRDDSDRPLLVLDQHNLDSHYWSTFSQSNHWLWRAFARRMTGRCVALQKRWFPRFDLILSVSSGDRQQTLQYVEDHDKVVCVPNGVDIDYFAPVERPVTRPHTQLRVVFGGSMDVGMNQQSVMWFVSDVWPVIKREVPEAEFWIVGRDPPVHIRRLADNPCIVVTGTVPDVRTYYAAASVFVVPLLLGGGTKLKTLEAFSMALPVVSTKVGAQGLAAEHQRHLYVADEPKEFAGSVIRLLRDPALGKCLGIRARHLVENRYSWDEIVATAQRAIKSMLLEHACLGPVRTKSRRRVAE